VAVFAGSFDPITAGHVDLVLRALALADRLVVAVAVNASKQPMFALDEREAMVRDALAAAGAGPARVEVRRLDGLLVRFAQEAGAALLVRGLRNGSDFDYEAQMAQMNRPRRPGARHGVPRAVARRRLRQLDARARGVAPGRRRRRAGAA
jgi:pantetheine-phosphate adenylyltransferase